MIAFAYRCLIPFSAGALLVSGCSGFGPPLDAPNVMTSQQQATLLTERTRSWMLPQAKTAKKLIYLSNEYPGEVLVYDYKSGALVGTLSGFQAPTGQCVDARGDVWIADNESGLVSEYAHGGTAVLRTVKALQPFGCAIGPNGDLAVSAGNPTDNDELEIWKNGTGTPAVYSSEACTFLLTPAYDDHGNLIIEGSSSTIAPWQPCMLPSGSSSLVAINLHHSLAEGGGAAWDGQHIILTAVKNGPTTDVFRVAIAGSESISIVGATTLTSKSNCKDFGAAVSWPFVVGNKNTPVNRSTGTTLLGGDDCPESPFNLWRYPSGGKPIKAIGSPLSLSQTFGASVSIAT